MKRFAKTPALIGGILGCIALVLSLISMLTIPMAQLQGMTLVSILFNAVTTVLVAIALFRGKKDVLAGIFFGIAALQPLLTVIAGLLGILTTRYPTVHYILFFANLENLLLFAAFAFIALDCFIDLKLSGSAKATVLALAVVLHFVLDAIGYGGTTYLSFGFRNFYSIGQHLPKILPMILGYIIGVLPATAFRVLTAVAAKGTAPIAVPEHTGEKTVFPPEYHSKYDPQPQQAPVFNWYGYLQPGDPGYEQYCQPKPQAPRQTVQASAAAPVAAAPVGSTPKDRGYIGLGGHIALCLLTFGIWPLIWTYKTTATLNQAPGMPQKSPVSQLLLCMFVPFYIIFWYFNQGKRVDALCRSKGIASDSAAICLITGIFLPIVAMILIQDKINRAALAA